MLDGKVVLITGANGGLGNVVTRAFLQAGATVYGASRAIHPSEFDHSAFHALPAEIRSASEAQVLVSQVTQGAGRLDSLLHLVGGFAGGKYVEETETAVVSGMMELNFLALFYMLQAVLPVMRARQSGSITAIGSRTAVMPQGTLGAYSASKAAAVSLMQTVALETKGSGVTANVVLPGTMNTPANRAANPSVDPSRWVQPAQVAALLVHLASPAASQISGAVIPIYGGEL